MTSALPTGIFNPWQLRLQPQPAVIIQQTEPPQTDNTLIEALTSQLHFVTIRKQRKKLSPIISEVVIYE